uniref:putative ubiquitin-conjugating enzyme E2 38 isoform X2 n=1 Tax=Fragaria vesca subsp. vesca TaxID=101020 RepID=UPI0005C80963|nr:PREDICTED: putative ubiquitin-conjugating enzyme E2 38 isoform X2 [Fragaria vesca subsp. vesca]
MDSEATISKKLKQNQACDPGSSASLAGSLDSFEPLKSSGSTNSIALKSSNESSDLPPGVEASLPWLKDPSPSENTPSTKKLTISDAPFVTGSASGSMSTSAACSSAGPSESSSSKNVQHSNDDSLTQKFQQFKQFDVVEDFSDHHYSRMGFSDEQPPKNWAKRIQEEWKILENDLPDTIFVRVYEARMELLRAVIIGPTGTPYHDGLFVFDCLFPTDYPNSPPMVYYYSGGLRLNPNLYECGKVCLSLLGTWSGKQRENWIPGESTMLQVLVSIQALILNADPYFNEPGYEKTSTTVEGQKQSRKYSEEAFIMSLKTMMYTLRKPPKYFEDFVSGHFRNRAHNILEACKAYSEGTVVGSAIGDAVQNGVDSSSREFKSSVARMMNTLVTHFTRNGSTDCEQFRGAA